MTYHLADTPSRLAPVWRSTIGAAVAMVLFGASISHAAAWIDARRYASEERSRVVADLSTVRARLEGITHGTFSATSGLVDVISHQGSISPDLFTALAEKAIKWHPHIRTIVVAPNKVIALSPL